MPRPRHPDHHPLALERVADMKPKRLVVVRFRQDRRKWEVDHANPPGVPPARSRPLFATEAEATEYAAKMVKRLEAGAPVADDPNMTLERAFERYFRLKARKRSLAEDRRLAEHLKKEFGQDTRLKDLATQPGRIAAYKERRLASTSTRRKGADGKATPLSAASINRPLALLRHLLRLAYEEWGVLPQVPRIKLEREPEGRVKWLEVDEEERLLRACAESGNEILLPIVSVALETGMRYSEIMGMEWERVDLSRGVIRLERTKSGRRREVPMRQVVYDVLARLPGPREGRVWPGERIRTAWERAVERARLDDWHFHDCRHHFASWFMMRGGNLLALSRILGHAKLSMTEKYAHLAPDHLRNEIARTERPAQAVEPVVGTMESAGDEDASQVIDFRTERRGSSVAEQLIRNQ
jgi:integrase